MKTWLAFLLVIFAAGAWAVPRAGSVVGAAQANAAVQLIPPGQKLAGNPGEKGATYQALEVHISLGGYLACNYDEASAGERLASYPAIRVLLQTRIQNRVGDLIGNLVRMPFGY